MDGRTPESKRRRIGVVGIEGGWSSARLVDAFAERGCDATLIDMVRVEVDLDRQRARCGDLDLTGFDALVVKKISAHYCPAVLNRLAMLRYVSELGVPVYSDPARIKRVIDRLSCTVTLRLADIPMPPTIVTEDVHRAAQAVTQFGRVVLKPIYSSKARGMRVVDAGPGAERAIHEFRNEGNQLIYVQKLLQLPGRDMGLVFCGGVYIGCYARVQATSAWNTTTHSGGRYEAHTPDSSLIELAHRAQRPFQLAFTCVDVAETEEGPVVFEVSAFGGFRGLWESQGVDAADRYASHVLSRLHHAS